MSVAISCALIAGCGSYDPKLVDPPAAGAGGAGEQNTDGAGAGGSDAQDGGADASSAGRSGGGGSGGETVVAGSGGDSGTPAADDCIANADALTAVSCPFICPESCNGADDDCDAEIDEADMEVACALDHAVSACIDGACVIVECTDEHRDCDRDPATGCEAPADDVNNCGQCGTVCSLPNVVEACVEGVCVAAGCEELFGNCDAQPNDCETPTNTLTNCAVCGVPCADVPNATASCERGFCGPGECTPGYGDCNRAPGDGCEQTLDAQAHCGGCDVGCDLPGSVDACTTGVCLATSCEAGNQDCDSDPTDGCESLDSDEHCGACNASCNATLTNVDAAGCENMVCQLDCAAQFADCDDDPATGCETDIWTNDRCGACDTPCEIPNAVVDCPAGVCSFVRCNDGFGDCNSDLVLDGCETELNQDQYCGSCDTDCTVTSDPVCAGGQCSDVVCPDPDTADCAQNGLPCEVDLLTDPDNCGGCGVACAFSTGSPHAAPDLICDDGQCQPVCDPLWADCNGDYQDGCETPTNTLTNCGGCGDACAIANASATCASGQCEVSSCASDWADCNMDDTSCETQLGTTSHCTGCGMGCSLANAVATCAGSAGSHSCAVSACTQTHFANCDNTASNGCEVDKRTNVNHCGACGNACRNHAHVSNATCSANACNYTCAAGWGNCNSTAGCETALNTNTDCTGCGVACSRSNGTASCSTGSCQLTGCNAGFGNCDGNAANGCEPLTTLSNCGACGTTCSIVNATASCATQSCVLSTCNSGWGDCDGSQSNGCERNINPPAMGGQGPCQPDTGCSQFTHDSRSYYFCTTDRTWADARSRCQLQLLGDLVHINDATEDAFVRSHLTANAWIGAQDTTEGSWRWANDNVLFWTGLSNGTANAYAHWNAGEPNDSGGNEDCAEIRSADGLWNDQPCTAAFDFVCEVQADLCPSDPNKANPGQCGCGVADTDTDGDGTANCNDLCPNNAPKVAPGVCGCAVADTDSDGDGTPNCNDACPNNAPKTAPGVCGCAVADTDSDGDGTPNCNDACPSDPMRIAAPCGFNYMPSNFDATTINFNAAPTPTLNCGTTTVDTTGAVTISNWCGTVPTPVIRTQSGGPEVVILPVNNLTINSANTLRVIGTRPLILAVRGNATINGTINARGIGATPGAGGNVSCGGGNGGNGVADGNGDDGDGGGGGGAFGAVGASGGSGHGGGSGGGAGAVEGNATLVPLRGGCRGGTGGSGGAGGAGGGALQISASGSITITSGAVVSASGGGGLAGNADEEGGGGGGSGGAILLQAVTVLVNSGAWVTTNGGGGASGNSTVSSNGAPGTDGYPNQTARAPGGPGNNGGGDGGLGGAQSGGASGGQNGSEEEDGCIFLCDDGGGGGGGGGGVGRIRINGTSSCTVSGSLSPAASIACP
jgi:hypothetical protein